VRTKFEVPAADIERDVRDRRVLLDQEARRTADA